MSIHLCPYCKDEPKKIRIMLVTETGIAFICPVHRYSGIRHDSMNDEQRARLNLDTYAREKFNATR